MVKLELLIDDIILVNQLFYEIEVKQKYHVLLAAMDLMNVNDAVLLARKFELGGEIILPKRAIKSIDFQRVDFIYFGKKDFKNNPLSFYTRNRHIYGEMTRSELRANDPGLYNELLRTGQMQQAIPKRGIALDHYNKNRNIYAGLSRTNLRIVDDGLYQALRRSGSLNKVIPEIAVRDWKKTDPLTYFKQKYPEGISRYELQKKDQGLYQALSRYGKLNEAIPKKP